MFTIVVCTSTVTFTAVNTVFVLHAYHHAVDPAPALALIVGDGVRVPGLLLGVAVPPPPPNVPVHVELGVGLPEGVDETGHGRAPGIGPSAAV